MTKTLAALKGNRPLALVALAAAAAVVDAVFGTDFLRTVLPSLLGL